MENFIGRENEINMLRDAFASQEAALVAVYGRRPALPETFFGW